MRLVEISSCPISGEPGDIEIKSVEDAFFGTAGTWRYRKNSRTGHLWLDPRPAPENISELYLNYYTHQDEFDGTRSLWLRALELALSRTLGYREPYSTDFLAKFVSYLPSVEDAAMMEMLRVPASINGMVLDIGCGNGAFLNRMKKAGWAPFGVEPDPKAAARLRDRFGFPVYSKIEELEETNSNRFNLITLNHVIEHLPDPVETLRRLGKLLTGNGTITITTPNVESIGARIFRRNWRGLEPPRHYNLFTMQSISEAFENAGYKVEKISTHSRLARGIFYLSALATRGHRELESNSRSKNKLLTIAGYLFQVIEEIAIRFIRNAGEEIYCTASAKRSDDRRQP